MMKQSFLIATAALLLAGCGQTTQKQEQAQKPSATEAASNETKTVRLEDVNVTWLPDVVNKQSTKTFPDADPNLIDSLGLQEGIPSSIGTFLVESNGTQILFDTGLGKENSAVLAQLDSMGIKPTDIKYLYLTHLHGDHIGGMMRGEEKVFPNAAVYLAQEEYDGWMKMPAEKNAQAVKTLTAYKEQLHLIAFGDTLPGNVVAINAVGHTPGHTVYQAGKLLIVGDILHGVALQLANPDICPTYDMDKAKAIESRKRILKYAADNGLTMAGMHFPAPGFIK